MFKRYKSENGLAGADLVITIFTIIIFITIISTIAFNLYLSNISIERNSNATSYVVNILEQVEKMYYYEVTSENLVETINENGNKEILGVEIPKGYNVNIELSNYVDNENSNMPTPVKLVSVKITYKVGNNEQNIQMQKLKKKENLKVPNVPELENNYVPVKYVITDRELNTGYYKKTEENDTSWYSYENKKWAMSTLLENIRK